MIFEFALIVAIVAAYALLATILVLGLAAVFFAWRDRNPRPGRLPDETFRRICDTTWYEQEVDRLIESCLGDKP